MIRVMLVDDDVNASEAMKLNLEVADDIRVVITCVNGQEAIQVYPVIKPDVIVMDINMPIINGIDACKEIKAINTDAKIIILTMFKEEEHLVKAFENKCDGFIYKGITRENLIRVIRNVSSGLTTIDHEAQMMLMNKSSVQDKVTQLEIQDKLKQLSDIEIELVKLVMRGKSNKEISQTLFLSEGHIRNMLMTLRRKVGVKNTIELGVLGAKMGF